MKLFLKFYLDTAIWNTAFSLAAALLSLMVARQTSYCQQGLLSLALSFATLGFGGSLLVYGSLHRAEYFFYHNHGWSKTRLHVLTGCLNGLVGTALFAIGKLVKAWPF